jgi:hypothetical protein
MIAENRGMMKTFLLGLSAGGACMAHCGSILLPLLLCQKTRRWKLAAGFLTTFFMDIHNHQIPVSRKYVDRFRNRE